MRNIYFQSVLALSILAASAAHAKGLKPANVTVGANLETTATVALTESAPSEGLQITVTSANPGRVRLSTKADEAGTGSIRLTVQGGLRFSPEFYVQGVSLQGSESSSITYTAAAANFDSGDGVVTLVPSAVVIGGPFGASKRTFQTIIGAAAAKISIFSVAVDPAGNYLPQPVAGGACARVKIASSDPAVGSVASPALSIAGGASSVATEFRPLAQGTTMLAASLPEGFSVPGKYASLTAIVKTPSFGITEQITIGQNLEVAGSLSLGAPAPKGGLRVTLTSESPEQLIISSSGVEKGSSTTTITVPEGATSSLYFLQALGSSGTATYSASAPDFKTRTATIKLSPSGLVLVGPLTLPEGQLLRSEAAGGARQHGFLTTAASAATLLNVYTVQLDPASHRAADITIQPLRPGVLLTVELKSTNPAVGTIDSPVTVSAGADRAVTHFTPLTPGATVLSLRTPSDFTESSNDTTLKVLVNQ